MAESPSRGVETAKYLWISRWFFRWLQEFRPFTFTKLRTRAPGSICLAGWQTIICPDSFPAPGAGAGQTPLRKQFSNRWLLRDNPFSMPPVIQMPLPAQFHFHRIALTSFRLAGRPSLRAVARLILLNRFGTGGEGAAADAGSAPITASPPGNRMLPWAPIQASARCGKCQMLR